jgi:HSP20 family protein
MNIMTTWNPLRDLDDMHDRVLRSLGLGLKQRVPDSQQQSLTTAEWAPSVDISEDDREYLIKAELPEVNKEDVKVTVENGVVTLKGERKFEKEENNKKYHRIERSYGSFLRSFSIPEDADPNKVTADFKDGVLMVRLTKSEEKLPRHIEVTVN